MYQKPKPSRSKKNTRMQNWIFYVFPRSNELTDAIRDGRIPFSSPHLTPITLPDQDGEQLVFVGNKVEADDVVRSKFANYRLYCHSDVDTPIQVYHDTLA